MSTDVVLVAGSFHPREGGAERQMRALLSELSSDGYRVLVVTQVLEGEPRRARVDGVNVTRVGSRWLFRRAPRLAQVHFVAAAFVTALRNRPERLLSLQMGTASASAALAARTLQVPHVLRLTGGGTPTFASEPLRRSSTRIGRLWCRLFDRPKTTVVAPARHLLDNYRESFPRFENDLVHIINGVSETQFETDKTDDVIWYSRSGSVQSGASLASIAAGMPDVSFSVLGQGVVPSASNVHPLGWQFQPEPVIGRHRVLLNTSAQEGMPNTVLQALSQGVRVVGFQNAGMVEVQRMFPDGVTLVPVDDLAGAATAIRTALASTPLTPQQVPTLSDVRRRWAELLIGKEGSKK